ncbi:hypothetical protein R3P38DRAFT_2768694 [Favolaschia claudopus]|uniref:Uncharacterized protein n=1 Tax=Favolaschia claudopus TaxID=2862362 RepID=A0AAW0CR09_9AGAR
MASAEVSEFQDLPYMQSDRIGTRERPIVLVIQEQGASKDSVMRPARLSDGDPINGLDGKPIRLGDMFYTDGKELKLKCSDVTCTAYHHYYECIFRAPDSENTDSESMDTGTTKRREGQFCSTALRYVVCEASIVFDSTQRGALHSLERVLWGGRGPQASGVCGAILFLIEKNGQSEIAAIAAKLPPRRQMAAVGAAVDYHLTKMTRTPHSDVFWSTHEAANWELKTAKGR